MNGGDDPYPGITIKPEGAKWDLSHYGHVEAEIANTGTRPLQVWLRVDNAGNWQDNPWNTEAGTVPPGERRVVSTYFGYSYGRKKGFALDPSQVVGMVLFASKSSESQDFNVLSIRAAGVPHEAFPVAADDVRVKPAGGWLLGPSSPGARSADGGGDSILLSPNSGRWDLSDYTDLVVRVRNVGNTPIRAWATLQTNGGNSDRRLATEPVKAGATADITVPFFAPIDLDQPAKPGQITSDAVKSVTVSLDRQAAGHPLSIVSIRGVVKTADIPSWLGKRPPVDGDWVKTVDDEFDGTSLNRKLWSATGENYYDKVTHWSKDDVLIGGGVARMRYEKKTGFQNDDPKRNLTPYGAGYLDGYDHWAQRYGYFESRMKLPTAPGLWPAFWMMPDRGPSAGDHGARGDTANGGMEFDIMEHLSRWGPYRYNITMHWDGYGKDHKALGSEHIYIRPDKDGYITCGLLWLPGEAVYYCNGVEVLRWKSPRVSSVPSTIMFTMPSGGWDNNELDDRQLPADLVIDYVRVWQRKDLTAGR
jgi:beta-glucanase (GH16 family)